MRVDKQTDLLITILCTPPVEKGKEYTMPHEESWLGADLLQLGLQPVGG